MALRPLATFLLTLTLTIAAPAQVVLSNLGTASSTSLAINNNAYRAQAFATPAGNAWQVNSITLGLGMANNTAGNFVAGVFGDAAGEPASLIGGWLVGSINPETSGDYVYTNANLVLQPGTTYWLVTGVSSGLGQYQWKVANTTTYGTSTWIPVNSIGFNNAQGAFFNWTMSATSTPYKFAIDATAIPEPATYAASAGTALLVFAFRRRRREAKA